MFFKKKSKKETRCESCSEGVDENYSFCPHCGFSFLDPMDEIRNFGMLGRTDETNNLGASINFLNMGLTEKIISSIMQNFMKNMNSQMKRNNKENMPEIQSFPNGIKIKIGLPVQRKKPVKKSENDSQMLTKEQLEKMSTLPRATAKASIRRLPDKVIYEVSALGIESPQDIFISKTESGYEVKAIGKNKIYTNNLPINLPLKGYSINEKGLSFEFSIQ